MKPYTLISDELATVLGRNSVRMHNGLETMGKPSVLIEIENSPAQFLSSCFLGIGDGLDDICHLPCMKELSEMISVLGFEPWVKPGSTLLIVPDFLLPDEFSDSAVKN